MLLEASANAGVAVDQRREHGNMADAAHATATDEAKVAATAEGMPDTRDNDDVRGSGDDVGSGGGDAAAAKKVLKPPVWNPSALAAPIRLSGEVVRGFGRGSKMLGIPTANLPPEAIDEQVTDEHNGVFFGWASVGDGPVYKTVLSIGWCVHDARVPARRGEGQELWCLWSPTHVLRVHGWVCGCVCVVCGWFDAVCRPHRNPFFKNKTRTVVRVCSRGTLAIRMGCSFTCLRRAHLQEPYLLHEFDADFYGEQLQLLIAGFLREQADFSSLGALATPLSSALHTTCAMHCPVQGVTSADTTARAVNVCQMT